MDDANFGKTGREGEVQCGASDKGPRRLRLSVGGAAPDAEHLGKILNLRLALDPSLGHPGF